MKQTSYLEWILCIFITPFMISCAEHRVVKPSPTISPENLPQIGSRYPVAPRNKPRPVILAELIHMADNQIQSNKPEAAFHTLERALDIEGQDPLLWHLMAKVQQMQNNFEQAEYFAIKSNAMAARIPSLKRKNWQIIGQVLEKLGRIQDAEEAYKNAR